MKKILLMSVGGIHQLQDETREAIATDGKETSAFTNFLNDMVKTWHIEEKPEIVALPLLNKSSSNIIPDDWKLIIDNIVKNYDDYDAFLITHGTNTLGYTCAALSFALGKLGKPVVLTGSQISYGSPGSDAQTNLTNAIHVIAKDEISGVMAVFGSQIISGTQVKKINSFEIDCFTSFGRNSLGRIGTSLIFHRTEIERHMSYLQPQARNAKDLDIKNKFDMNIASLTEFPGMRSELFKILVDTGVRGIIFQATGAGDPNVAGKDANYENLRDGFEYLQKYKIPIVIATQEPSGIATMDLNEPGLLAFNLGAIPAWDMTIAAMTTKLAWLLGRGFPYEEMRTLMTQSFRGEVSEIRRR